MTSRLSITQKTILTSAAARPDGSLFPVPDTVTLRGKALDRTLASLIRRGFAVGTAPESGPNRNDGDVCGPGGVRITLAGRAAIGSAACDGSGEELVPDQPPAVAVDVPLSMPGGKLGVLLQAMCSERGATLGDLASATSWLGHTTRAALTRLRQRGFDIRLERIDGRRVYRLYRAA